MRKGSQRVKQGGGETMPAGKRPEPRIMRPLEPGRKANAGPQDGPSEWEFGPELLTQSDLDGSTLIC